MIYKVLLVIHISGIGYASTDSQIVEFPTLEEASCCLKQFSGNSVIDAFALNWRG